MTEQPAEQFQLTVTNTQAAAAMATFMVRQDVVDLLMVKAGEEHPDWDRVQVEDEARRLVLSSALCIACGVSAQHEQWLFKNDDYQALLGRMLFKHDTADLEGLNGL